jgi:hypothetical protein
MSGPTHVMFAYARWVLSRVEVAGTGIMVTGSGWWSGIGVLQSNSSTVFLIHTESPLNIFIPL